jgi:hypothetical protein
MSKQLKIWNGRGHGKYDKYHIYVAAFTQKQAAELVSSACFGCNDRISVSELRNYYFEGSWGNPMDGIVATEPCVYINSYKNPVPEKII